MTPTYGKITIQYMGGPIKVNFSYDPELEEDNRMLGPGGGTGLLSRPEKEFFRAILTGAIQSMDTAEKAENRVIKEMRA